MFLFIFVAVVSFEISKSEKGWIYLVKLIDGHSSLIQKLQRFM